MDNRFLRAGSTLYLPVNVPGALVSFADPHAAQGDGEVCGTAIETSCTAHASNNAHNQGYGDAMKYVINYK